MLSFEENLCLLEEELKVRTKYIEIEQSNLYPNMSNIVAIIDLFERYEEDIYTVTKRDK